MKAWVVVLLCLTALSGFGRAQNEGVSENSLSEAGQKAFKVLLSANRFEDTHIGYAGELSKYVEAYRILLKEGTRVDALKELLEKASTVGQLYALVGLYEADNAYFHSIISKYKSSNTEVKTISGCIGSTRTVGEIVFLDKANTIRLEHPGQPFGDWKRKANIPTEEGFLVDIFGGGYSFMFRGHDL
jgi:hypothetical protein